MTDRGLSVTDIAGLLVAKLPALLDRLGIDVKVRGHHGAGRRRNEGGIGDSFTIELTGPKAGLWYHHAAGDGGDLVSLIKYIRQCDVGDAVRWAKLFLGIEQGDAPAVKAATLPKARDRDAEATAEEKRRRAGALWQQGRPATGNRGEEYLRIRGLRIPVPPTLRYHHAVWHPFEGREFPCLLARVDDGDGRFKGVWRIYIDPVTSGKPAIEQRKLGLGATSGGAVHLAPMAELATRLDVGEGVETMLGVVQRFPYYVTWAALSTSGLKGLVLPCWAEELVIWADLDPIDPREWIGHVTRDGEVLQRANPMFGRRPGTVAAEDLAARARKLGKRVSIVYPGSGDGTDFGDVFAADGESDHGNAGDGRGMGVRRDLRPSPLLRPHP